MLLLSLTDTIYICVCVAAQVRKGVFLRVVRSFVRSFVGGWGGGFRTIGWMVRC